MSQIGPRGEKVSSGQVMSDGLTDKQINLRCLQSRAILIKSENICILFHRKHIDFLGQFIITDLYNPQSTPEQHPSSEDQK